jgi:ABC-type multidrug transport system permease subunit
LRDPIARCTAALTRIVSSLHRQIGFVYEAEPFFLFLLTVWALTLAFASLGFFLAATLPNFQVATIMSGMITSFLALFAGFFVVRHV